MTVSTMAISEPQYDDEWEDDTSADFFEGLTVTPNHLYSGASKGEYDYPPRDEEPVVLSSRVDGPRDVWGQEVIALVKNTVDTSRKAMEASLASSGLTGDAAAQTKLTIQLKSQGLSYFPADAVDLLKPDVERLVLAHNAIPSIPNNFGELQGLTFLNVRANKMKEFPKAFLKLSRLQMLDISRNDLQKIPEQIDQMKSLKVLSASGNKLETVPNTLGSLQALKILKIDNNPLDVSLKRVIEAAGGFGSGASHPPQQTEHELNLTLKIKEFLRAELSSISSQESGDSSESPLETPRPLRRNNSLRFPVAVSGLTSSESTPDLTSPSSQRFGSAKAHQRVISGAGAYTTNRRQGVSTLLMNDRIRSNSEGVASQQSGPKRLALPTKQALQLSEGQSNRNSLHLRGVSHGSALKDRPPTGRSTLRNHTGAVGADMAYGPGEAHQFRRLSSLPEAEVLDIPGYPSCGVQACKQLLYSLHQIHVYMGTQPNIVRQGTPKRSSLERVYYNATTHLQTLDDSLCQMHAAAEEDDYIRETAVRNAREACRACIIAYKQVLDLISRSVEQYIAQTDPLYVRTFLHMLYASIIEATNSATNLRKVIEEESLSVANRTRSQMAKERVPKLTVRQTTPIKERPRNISTRLRSDTFNRPSSSRMKSSSNPYSAVPLYLNNGRSRSNSRGMGGGPPSANSSMSGTPRSGESFFMPQSPGLPTPAQDYSPHTNADFNNQDLPFEAVFNELIRAVREGMVALPGIKAAFRSHHQRSLESRLPKRVSEVWYRLEYDARNCHQAVESLRARLAAVKLKDLEVRRSPEFWSFGSRYVNTFVKMMDDIKAARATIAIEPQTLKTLKPVHKAVKQAVHIMQTSPWAHFLQASPSLSQSRSGSHHGSPAHSRTNSKDAAPSVHHGYANGYTDRLRTTGLGVSNVPTSNGNLSARARGDSEASLSPYAMGMPQTPLSAALGPAAQATIPTSAQMSSTAFVPGTPPKTSFDTSFRGDVFERADTLLRSNSVIGHRR